MFDAFNIDIDQGTVTSFFRALDMYAEYRHEEEGKSFAYALNRTAQNVAGYAAHFTHHASTADLRKMLGQAPIQFRVSKKSGNTYRVKSAAKATNDAGRILAARMRQAGKNPHNYSAVEWHEKVRLFVGRTLRSVNFMRSGWLPSYRDLTLKTHQSAEVDRQTAFGRTQEDERGEFAKHSYPSIGGSSAAAPSTEGLTAEIFNRAINPRNRTSWSEGLGRWGAIGLEQALAFKTSDMLLYLEQAHDAKVRKAGLS